MWTRITHSRIFLATAAIICAVVCWVYVDIVQAPKSTATIRNIPVTFVGEEALAEEGLMITSGTDATVSLTLEGTRTAISQVDSSNITITVQLVSQVTEAGHYSLYYEYSLPSSVSSSLRVTSRSVTTIEVDVVQMESKTVDIVGQFTGTTAEGAQVSDNNFEFECSTLTVSGESSLVDQVDHALVTLDEEELSDTWSGYLTILLIDADGDEVSTDGLTLDLTEVYTIFPVQYVKEVELTVDTSSGGGATSDNATISIDPDTVTITGTQEALAEIDSIDLGTIDLSEIVTSEVLTLSIPVPDDVTIVSGISTATVTVSMTGLTTRLVQTSNIELINVPDGLDVELITQALEVRIRGDSSTMELVFDEDVYVIVDLSGIDESTEGTRTITATVGVSGFADVGAVGDYQVMVNITAATT